MRAKYLLAILFLVGQIPALLSQGIPTATLDRDRVTAGDTLELKVTFSEAPSYAATVQVYFDYKRTNGTNQQDTPAEIYCGGTGKAGSKQMEVSCRIPFDQGGGIYHLTVFRLLPPPGGSHVRDLNVAIPDFEVVPLEDKNVYPKTAVASISLDQKQVLQNGAIKIDTLLDQLNTRVEGNSAETADLKAYLYNVASTGKAELEHTRAQYRQTLPSGKAEPIFFEDFDRQFTSFIEGVGAPKTASLQEQNPQSAHFMLAQLSSTETIIVHPTPLDGSLGPFVSNLAQLLANLRDAYHMIIRTGSDTFTISLRSTPPGAAISYRRIGEAYQDYSSPTDVDQATFPYAMWTFRFTINHCDVIKRPNPYIEQSPNLTVSMLDCVKR